MEYFEKNSNKNSIAEKIYTIRGIQVMLDSDLAELYGYETKKLNQQVKRNIERFPEDFMFQLTVEELNVLRSQIVTSRDFNIFQGKDGGRRYLPYVFTEQGVNMLAAVLKSETAIQQSIMIMRTFKEMRHYLAENRYLITAQDYLRLSKQVNDNTIAIREIKEESVLKDDLDEVMKEFLNSNIKEDYLFLNGEKFSADLAYTQIYTSAKHSIFIIDNYIGLRTLTHLKNISNKIQIMIFSDNLGKGLTKIELNDFKKEFSNVNVHFKITNGKNHDRYIILDYGTSNELIYHCGASSKDAGNKVTSISKINDITNYRTMIQELLLNQTLSLK